MTMFLLFWLVVLGGILLLSVAIAKVRHPRRELPLHEHKMWDTYTDITLYHIDKDRDDGDWLY